MANSFPRFASAATRQNALRGFVCLVAVFATLSLGALPTRAQSPTASFFHTISPGGNVDNSFIFNMYPYSNQPVTWNLAIQDLVTNTTTYASKTTPAPSVMFYPLTLPNSSHSYALTLSTPQNPGMTWINYMASGSQANGYCVSSIWNTSIDARPNISIAFGEAAPAGSTFPYTVGLLDSTTGQLQTFTQWSAPTNGTSWAADFNFLTPNHVYYWAIEQGTFISAQDPQFVNRTYIACTTN